MSARLLRRDDGVELRRLVVGPLRTNCYLISCRRTGDTAVVDPGEDPAGIVGAAGGRRVVAVLLTHAHWDHVQAADGVRARSGAPVLAHPSERAVWAHELDHLGRHGQWDWALDADRAPADGPVPVPGWNGAVDRPLNDEDRIVVGDVLVEALHTPGHSPGSVSFRVGGDLLTGDTLFPGGPGLTGWPLSDFPTVMLSVERLLSLPEKVRILPGHGRTTTIGQERPFADEWRARGW